jgi:hypothetical protein
VAIVLEISCCAVKPQRENRQSQAVRIGVFKTL